MVQRVMTTRSKTEKEEKLTRMKESKVSEKDVTFKEMTMPS